MRRTVLSLMLAALLAACSSTLPRPISYYAVVPEPGWPTVVGKVTGSLIKTEVYIEAIDGLPISDAVSSSVKPVSLAPGPHVIHVSQRMGQFFGTVPFRLDVEYGATYQAYAQQDVDSMTWYNRPLLGDAGGPTFFWIEDMKSGKPVTPQQRIQVSTNGSPTVVPIVIPRAR